MKRSRTAYVALGSNLGPSLDTIARALFDLRKLSRRPLLTSSLWRTPPVDCPPHSPDFVNAVTSLETLESPARLLRKLHALEKKHGRLPRKISNEPRSLDLDLIALGDCRIDSAELTLPHPRAHLRRFVLQPLAEIAPDLVLPGQTRTVRQLLRALPRAEGMRRVALKQNSSAIKPPGRNRTVPRPPRRNRRAASRRVAPGP
jgi:2-amino-4-hydroxy-6-hydroxymethyldihydropteridine diphosphokinase